METSNIPNILSTSHFSETDILSFIKTFVEQSNTEAVDRELAKLTQKVTGVFQTANKGLNLCIPKFCIHEDHFEVCFPEAIYEVKVIDRLCRKPYEKEIYGHPAKDPYLSCRPTFKKAPDCKIYLTVNALQEDYLPFHCAVLEPDSNLYFGLRYFCNYRVDGDINQIDADGNNALHIACMSMKWDLVFDLIDSGCNPAQRNGFGDSPLDILARNKEMEDELFISILGKLPDINVASTVLHNTLSTTIADYLIEKNILIDALNANGYTPLVAAIKNSMRWAKSGEACYYYVEHLCQKKANLELGLPFHQIIKKHETLDFFELLMKYGGNVNQVDVNGDNALMLACEVIPIYQQKDIKKNEENDEQDFNFPFNRYHIFIEDLIKLGCDYMTPNKFGISPLVIIAQNYCLSDARIFFLLKQNIIRFTKTDPCHVEKSSEALKIFLTPLLPIMHITQDEKIINLFLKKGFPIDSFDRSGRSLLFSAVNEMNIFLAQYLIDNGANPTLVSPNINTRITKNLKNCSPMSPIALLKEKIEIQFADAMIDNTLCREDINEQPCAVYNDPLSNKLFSEITQYIPKIDKTKLQGAALSTYHLLLVLKDILSFKSFHLL